MKDHFSEDQISMLVQNIPRYMYIKIDLTNKIKSGELPIGTRLDTERKMCEYYGCSRITVRKALEDLMQEGYVYKVQGLGTFVKDRVPQKQNLSGITSCSRLIMSQNMTPSKRILNYRLISCDAAIAAKLGIAEGLPVLEYERVYYANNVPVIYGKSYFNASILPGIERFDLSNQSIVTILQDTYNLQIHCSSRDLRAVVSDNTTATLLGVPNHFPLLQVSDLKTSLYRGVETPIEYYVFLYVTERISYSPEI